MDLSVLIWPTVDQKELARVLDGVGEQVRTSSVLDLDRRELANLFEAAADNEPYTLLDLVPADTPPLVEVIHEGKNSLPLFSRFQKRFCRPEAPTAEPEVWGYNEQVFQLFTGPGYFVAHPSDGRDLLVDYTRAPWDKPPHWPEILPNSARLGRFIYYGTNDVLRRVSRHVSVGRARRGDKPMDAWFVLTRQEPSRPGEEQASR